MAAGACAQGGTPSDPARQTPPDSSFLALRRDLPSALLAVLLFLIPLYRTRVLEDSFNTPKLALALVISVLAAVAILARPRAMRVPLRLYVAPWLVVALAAWLGASSLWAESKPLAVDGTVYFAVFAVLVWLFMRGPTSLAALRGMFNAGAAAAVATAVWVLFDDFAGGEPGIVARLPDWRGNLSAGLGNSGHIAGMIGMFLPWLLLMFLRGSGDGSGSSGGGWRRWIVLLGIALSFAALTVTWSVGSSGATIIALLLWAVIAWRVLPKGSLRWGRIGWVIAAGITVVAFFFLPAPGNPHSPSIYKQAFSSQRWEDGWPTRIVIWETTWHIIKQEPLVGMGTGNFTYMYTQQIVPSVRENPALIRYAGQFTNNAHNDYMQLWAEGGVVALALWLAALSTCFGQIWKMLRRKNTYAHEDVPATSPSWHLSDSKIILLAAGAGLTVFALDGLMSFPMYLPAHFCMAMFFIAVPGVLLRVGACGVPVATISSRQVEAFGSGWRVGGVGVLLTLAACVWHHGHRVTAEFYLKSGRSAAESTIVDTGQGYASPWQTCEMMYHRVLMGLADGAAPEELQSELATMKSLAETKSMQHARELFEKSLAADRWYANASSRLGQLLIFQNDWHGAFDVSRRTLKTLETYEIHQRMAMAAFLLGDMKKSHEHWTICENRVPLAAEMYGPLAARTAEGK